MEKEKARSEETMTEMQQFAKTYSHCLLHYQGDKLICDIFHPTYKYQHVMDVPELSDAIIRCAKHGWLLFSQGKRSLFFFNPFTKSRIQLPDLPEEKHYNCEGITFSHAPTSPDCVVFGICGIQWHSVITWTIQRRDNSWTSKDNENNLDFHPSYSSPIFSVQNNVFCCLGRDGKLGVFDSQSKDNSWTVLYTPSQPSEPNFQNYLVESDGELFSVSIGPAGKWVEVFKLYRSKMIWQRVTNLGGRTFFVSYPSSFSGTVSGMQNSICFPRFHGEDYMCYSLETGKHHAIGSDYSSEDLYNTTEHVFNTWFELKVDYSYSEKELNWI